jgi:membrane protein implicated in regulation of membrane protease activity
MNWVLSALLPVLESLGDGILYDAPGPGLLAIGLVFLIVAGVVIIGLIVLAVVLLRRYRKKQVKP